MKKKLLFIFGIIACWMTSHAQVPEYLYYKFDDSTVVHNYASNPQGNQNIPVPSNLFIDTVGFNNSNSLSGNAGPAIGGVNTGFYPNYNHSFTIGFWYRNDAQFSGYNSQYYFLFGDSLAGFYSSVYVNAFLANVGIYSNGTQLTFGFFTTVSQGAMIDIVYDATPTPSGPYGTYTIYVNGTSLLGARPATSPPFNQSSGLVLGSAPFHIPASNASEDVNKDLGGNIDEFRWYNRALTSTEIQNTMSSSILALGNCSSFTNFAIDSISGDAAKISWIPGNASNSFALEYDTAGFTPGTGTTISGSYPGSNPPVVLSNLTDNTEYDVYFKEYCSNDSIYYPHPFTFKTTALCPPPFPINFTSVTDSSVTVDWQNNAPSQDYYLTYGPAGFDPLNGGQTDTVSSLPFTVNGLQSGTDYDFYLENSCGGTYGNSIQVPRTIATECAIKSAPYFEDFEDSTWIPANIYGTSPDTINTCWTRTEFNSHQWTVQSGSIANGPISGKGGSGKYLRTPTLAQYGQTAAIYSPTIDISGLNDPYLSFYYHRYYDKQSPDQVQPNLFVEVNDGSGWQKVIELKGPYQKPSDPYKKIGADLSSFGDTIQIRFVAEDVSNAIPAISGIDDLSVDEAPSCPDIYDIHALTFGADTSVTFAINSYKNSYIAQWGPTGFTQGTGCFDTLSPPYTISGCISPNHDIDVYLKSCDGSTWDGPYTICGPYTAPYSTQFNDSDPNITIMPCWDMYSAGKGAPGDNINVDTDPHTTYSYSNFNALRLYNYYPESNDTLMAITPAFIDLPQGNKQIRFMTAVINSNGIANPYLIIGSIQDASKGSSFHAIDTVEISSKWNEYAVNLDPVTSAYNGSDTRIAIMLEPGLKQVNIDDFNYEEIPPCQAPLKGTLAAKDEWFNAITATWKKPTTGYSTVCWGLPGFSPNTGAYTGKASTQGTSYRIQNLNPGNSYEFYVRDSCSATAKSRWVGPYEFKTLCAPSSAPFLESFDDSTWVAAPPTVNIYGLTFANVSNRYDTINPCWARNAVTGTIRSTGIVDDFIHTWGVTKHSVYYVGSTSALATGPDGDLNDSGNYVFAVPLAGRSLGDNVPDTGDLYVPLVDISTLNHPYLSFYYHRFTSGNYMPDLLIQANDGTGWVTLDTLTGTAQTSATDPFYQMGIPLIGFNDTIRVRFRSLYVAGTDISHSIYNQEGVSALDNIEIKEAPPCVTPISLNAGFQIDTASGQWNTNLNWQELDSLASGAQLVVGSQYAYPDSLLAQGKVYNIPGTINSLTVDTLIPGCYSFWVRTICSSGDTSSFSNEYRFCVPCAPQMAPLYEDFNTTVNIIPQLPSCWSQKHVGMGSLSQSYDWQTDSSSTSPLTGPYHDVTGNGEYVYTHSYGGTNGDTTSLYSPMVNIDSVDKPQISFAYHMFGNQIDTLHLDIFDGFNWHRNALELGGQQQNLKSDAWIDTTVKLQAFCSYGYVQARFRAKSIGYNGQIALDNIFIGDTITCPKPSQFMMAGNTDSSATLTWNSNTNGQSFIIEYGPVGFIPGSGSQLTSNVDSINVPATDNRIYDAYLEGSCGSGDTSLMVGPVKFYSKVFPCDDMEAYKLGPLKGQSSLFQSWDPGLSFPFKYQGDEEFSMANAHSGTKSIHLFEGPVHGESGIVAHFDEISSGKYAVNFSFDVTDTGGGFYTFVNSLANGSSEYVYLRQTTKTAEVKYTISGVQIGTFSYKNGWNDISHIIDFDNDTAWVVLNGVNTHLGWHFSNLPSETYPRLQGVQFLTTPSNINTTGKGSEFYIDDFCVSSFTCPAPDSLEVVSQGCTHAIIGWKPGVEGNTTLVEYDTTGFTPGTGTVMQTFNDQDTLAGLSPGGSYDVYVSEVCGRDTTTLGPLTINLISHASADFSFTLANANPNNRKVTFDGSASVGADSLYWDFGDSTSGNGVNPFHFYNANGTYTVTLIVTSSDCGSDTITKTVTITGIGLGENTLDNSLDLYPNPATDQLSIDFNGAGSSHASIRILDMSGKILYQKEADDVNGKYHTTVDLSRWASGVYMVEIKSGGMKAHRRITKR